MSKVDLFHGKTALVTGAGSGIGRALARELAQAGAKVVITDLVQDRIDEVVRELKAEGVAAGGYRVDHASFPEVQAFAKTFSAEWGPLDVLCSNAGVGHGAAIEEISIADWQWVLGVNLWGAIYLVHLFVPKMIERKQGWILITASGLGIMPAPGMAPYTTSKYAMVGLGESLRAELDEHGIKVSVLCPGVINTNIVRDGRINIHNREGVSSKSKVAEFYATRGTDPAVVARDGIRGLANDVGIIPSPFHTWPLYALHRISPQVYHQVSRYIWKKGWLV